MALFRRNQPAPGQSGQFGQPGPGAPGGFGGPGGDVRQMLVGAPVDRVRQDLRLSVTRGGPHLAPPALAWPLGDELAAVACVKLPDGQIVTAEIPMAQAWGMGPEDVWLQCATNLRGEHFARSEFDTAAGVTMTMFTGQGWPGTAHLVRIGEALGEDVPHGALVTVPDENTLLVVPLNNQRVLDVVPQMYQTGHEITRGQHPFSTRTYWWHEGVLEPLEVQWQGQLARVSGSPRFSQTVAALR
ncbi:hypothetical protein [Yinghuangia seranimata]|uniref:hypothetical protein n=1 Tax=Yinghuangia seranimata TaxID=408067 RepID=UPI00248B0D40|nr:hypothetical protein [Yinghuangia seranimata]MDI2124872.1 hypothetical protein [Yinghuangia seranimata]